MLCLNKDNEKYPYSSKLSKQKNAPFRGKFQGRVKMREIGLGGLILVLPLQKIQRYALLFLA